MSRKEQKKKTPFSRKVLDIVKKIPKGKILSYKKVAIATGSPNASRVVGNIMKKNMDPNVPCHRVIRSNGEIGGYNGLRGEKSKLLEKEGAL
ncbi:MAG TPA: MGMT family protein [Candidatus Paceibacterota bacterium]|jgi:O-6-methylguanine DNA methyltransferase|nr:6-O-methylguanine DNA methyltransferase [Parcubacteria group bacterium]MDP6119664.1 MGMT family protein [Candidatus Paceibacterota bacterium]HJN62762.1 MGMT family protein [Candidatus Paceibacterota bacterium]|tara:strand:+ start:626 stop:901 length:276 start_codon:yes stop_codon:yes gene_type:complete